MFKYKSIRIVTIGFTLLVLLMIGGKYAIEYSRNVLISLKLEESISYLSAVYETMDTSETGGYTSSKDRIKVIQPVIQALDRAYGVYACVYNDGLIPLMATAKSKSGLAFNPFEYNGIKEAVQSSVEGRIDIAHPIPKLGNRYKVALYFKWHPSDIASTNRICVILGVTTQAIPNTFENCITLVLWIFGLSSTLFLLYLFIKDFSDDGHLEKDR